MPHVYRVFDLLLESAIECAELLHDESHGEPDIRFAYGDVPAALEHPVDQGPRWQAAPGSFIVHVEDVGGFLIREGREILIQAHPTATEDSIRLFLLSGALSILLYQRRLFVLHCSGIATPRGAVLFAGRSGAGKSTTVSALLQRGYSLIADDMLAIRFDEGGRPVALPGFPQVKLWADSAKALGRETHGLHRVTPDADKFIAPEKSRFSSAPCTLHAIYDLRIGGAMLPALEPLAHAARFHILLDHTWQKATLRGLGVREWHFHTAARIASLTYAARLTRPAEGLEITSTADLLEADMQLDHAVA